MSAELEKSKEMISLTPEQAKQFQTAVKIGIYKELHKKGLLTDTQLNLLLTLSNN